MVRGWGGELVRKREEEEDPEMAGEERMRTVCGGIGRRKQKGR